MEDRLDVARFVIGKALDPLGVQNDFDVQEQLGHWQALMRGGRGDGIGQGHLVARVAQQMQLVTEPLEGSNWHRADQNPYFVGTSKSLVD